MIRKTIGDLLPRHIAIFRSNEFFTGVAIPDPDVIESLEQKIPKHIDPTGLELLRRTLDKDPSKRPTCEQLLQFPYFNNVKIPDLSMYSDPKTIMSGSSAKQHGKGKQSYTAQGPLMGAANRSPNSINLPQLTPTTPNLPSLTDSTGVPSGGTDGTAAGTRLTSTASPLKAHTLDFDIDSPIFSRRDSNNNTGAPGNGASVSMANTGVGANGSFNTVTSAIVASNTANTLVGDTKYGGSLTRSKAFEHLPNI